MSKEWDAILALAEDYNPTSPVYISPLSLAIFGYSLRWLQSRYAWRDLRDYLDEVTDADWDEIEAAVAKLTKEIWSNMLGQIVILANEEIPDNMLICDGATYDRVDYPELYEVIAESLKLDADTFVVPDLIVRFPIGIPTTDGIGSEDGSFEIPIVIDHLPSHTHEINIVDTGHLHGVLNLATVTAGLVGEIPAPVTGVIPGVTEIALTGISASASNTGENEPLNYMPEVTCVIYAMVAK